MQIQKSIKYLFTVLAVALLSLVFTSFTSAEERLSEKELDKLLLPYFENKDDIKLLDYDMKEILLEDVKETGSTILEVNVESASHYKDGVLIEDSVESDRDGNISIMSQIPKADLSQFITSTKLSNNEIRVSGYWEWKKKEVPRNERFGLAVSNDFNIISGSYACRINSRNTTSEVWSYVGNCGGDGTAYTINRYGASWAWSNSLSRYYKGFGSYKVKANKSNPNNRAIMEYAYATSSGLGIGVSFGPVSVSHTSSGTLYKQAVDGAIYY